MLKRTAQTVRAVAEQAGIIAPSVADAIPGAEQRRLELVAAQHAVDVATSNLEAGHDANLAENEITKLESVLADARLTADRAQRSCTAAERRLQKARDGELARNLAAARVKLDGALSLRATAAARIDAAASELAQAFADLESHDNAIYEAITSGCLPRDASYTIGKRRSLAESALQRAGVIPKTYPGVLDDILSCSSAILKDNEHLRAMSAAA